MELDKKHHSHYPYGHNHIAEKAEASEDILAGSHVKVEDDFADIKGKHHVQKDVKQALAEEKSAEEAARTSEEKLMQAKSKK